MTTKNPTDSTTLRTAHAICREWRQVHLKTAYDVSMLDERDEEGTARIVDVADATKCELENELADASIATGDDVADVLRIALHILDEHGDAERAARLIRIAKDAAYRLGDAPQGSAA